jgi:hypothetical protein
VNVRMTREFYIGSLGRRPPAITGRARVEYVISISLESRLAPLFSPRTKG